MPEPLVEEISHLCRDLAIYDDPHVRDSALILADNYRHATGSAASLHRVEQMEQPNVNWGKRYAGRIERARVELRDGLAALLHWARETRRV